MKLENIDKVEKLIIDIRDVELFIKKLPNKESKLINIADGHNEEAIFEKHDRNDKLISKLVGAIREVAFVQLNDLKNELEKL